MAKRIITTSAFAPCLPLFLTQKNKWPIALLIFFISSLLYLTSNWIHLYPPQVLTFSWIDQVTPFLPLTVWIYISEYLFFIVIFICSKDLINLNKYFYAFLAQQAVSIIIFWIFPTTYPRDLFPLPPETDFLTRSVFQSLRALDTPANCCPSLHVSSVYLSSFIYLNEQRQKFIFFFLWATGIALSTLTTKQHYLFDLLAGGLLTLVTYHIFYRWLSYRSQA